MREIRIDLDTVVGFDYEKQYYYITNKDTTTTRTTAHNTIAVLDIVAPDHTITENDLISLAENMEALTSLYYTWEDTGAYIKTIQFNDYSKYPLTLDAEKKKIYIMNSTVIIDLTLNEGRQAKLEQVQAFYRDTLGLSVSIRDLNILYSVLLSFYYSTCYNTIELKQDTDDTEAYTLFYTNTLKLSDYRDISKAEYTCLLNPTNQYSYNTIASIQNITDNAITLTAEVPQKIKQGTTINIANTLTNVDTTSYSADGTYIVQSTANNQIFTTENLPASFNITLPTLNIRAYENPIVSIDRDKQSITLTNFATDFLIGDTIVVRGTAIQTEYETLSVDGFYSIIGIEDNVIYVDEVPLTNYEAPTGVTPTAYIYKPIQAGIVTAIDNNQITIADTPPSTLTTDTPIAVFTTVEGQEGTTYMQYATVTGINNTTITTDTTLTDNVPQYGLLREPIPYPYTLVTISDSKREDILPNGEFMLDTQEQAIQYLSLIDTLPLPKNEELDEETNNYIGNFKACGIQVVDKYMLDTLSTGVQSMECIGLYSRVYSEE